MEPNNSVYKKQHNYDVNAYTFSVAQRHLAVNTKVKLPQGGK